MIEFLRNSSTWERWISICHHSKVYHSFLSFSLFPGNLNVKLFIFVFFLLCILAYRMIAQNSDCWLFEWLCVPEQTKARTHIIICFNVLKCALAWFDWAFCLFSLASFIPRFHFIVFLFCIAKWMFVKNISSRLSLVLIVFLMARFSKYHTWLWNTVIWFFSVACRVYYDSMIFITGTKRPE